MAGSDRGTGIDLGPQYAAFAADRDAAGAEEYITDKLAEAVDEGELDSLPALYAHRAVWRLQLGLLRKAERDLNAAQRVKLSPEAEAEVRILLAHCYHELDRSEDAATVMQLARQGISQVPAPSALLLRHALASGSAMPPIAAARGAQVNASANAQPAAGTASAPSARALPAPAAANGHAVPGEPAPNGTASGAAQKASSKRSMAAGFFGGQKARTPANGAAAAQPPPPTPAAAVAPLAAEQISPNVGAAAGPLHADTVSEPVAQPVPPAAPASVQGSSNGSDDGADSDSKAAAAEEAFYAGTGSKVEIVDLDMDELDNALNAPLRTMTDLSHAAQQRLLHVMGAPDQSAGGHAHLQKAETDQAVSAAILQINAGRFKEADAALQGVLARDPRNYQALVARGTGRALAGSTSKRELRRAEADFSAAIARLPELADVWKRRSQARAAQGDVAGATRDLQQCLRTCVFESDALRGETLFDLAMLYHKQRNFRACRRVFDAYFAQSPPPDVSRETCSMLGLSATAMGDITEGVAWYKKALAKDAGFKDAWLNLFQAYKEGGFVKEAEQAFDHIVKLDARDKARSMTAYRFRAHMLQCMGQHAAAADVLTRALAPLNGKPPQDQRVECLYLRGACNHAMGRLAHAYADFDACFAASVPQGAVSQETLNFRATAYYQGELCVWVHKHLDADVLHFSVDRELDEEFKELWAKQVMPHQKLLARRPRQLKQGQKFPKDTKDVPMPPAATLAPLLALADHIGGLLQYTHQGFMSNARQQRAAGLAAVELAQRLHTELAARRSGTHTWVATEGASVRRPAESADARHAFGWRDAMDVVVRWRQIGEPNDQVLWVDRLTPEEFARGFGSHTPMFSGQTKCVRYYMNCDRALALFRRCVLEKGYAVNARDQQVPLSDDMRRGVEQAETPGAMWRAIGCDSWIVVPIGSVCRAGHSLEGTRLTITQSTEVPDGHEFSIRTPVTPPRWDDFDRELTAGFEAICAAALDNDKPALATAILHFAYFWYNFMPLARGSAAVGYTTVLSLFWAFGMPISVPIPPHYQTDWEAILCTDPAAFVKELSRWALPPAAFASDSAGKSAQGHEVAANIEAYAQAPLDTLPDVLGTLGTLRKRFYALNYGTDAAKPAAAAPQAQKSSGKKK